jgi:hypothetical protein
MLGLVPGIHVFLDEAAATDVLLGVLWWERGKRETLRPATSLRSRSARRSAIS